MHKANVDHTLSATSELDTRADTQADSSSEIAWTTVIEPHSRWWDLRLGELYQYRDLLSILVWRDFLATYKQTILGPLWFVINPLLTTIVFTIVFGGIAQISTDEIPRPVFYMSGITLWSYFSACVTANSVTFTKNANLFGKVYFPRLIMPVAQVLSNLLRFSIQFVLFLAFLTYFLVTGANLHTNWLLAIAVTPVLIAMLAGFAIGIGSILSALTTKYRDLSHLVGFGLQLAMYATPIIYPVSRVPEKYRWVTDYNPLAPVIELFRYAYLGRGHVATEHMLYSVTCLAATLIVGLLLFHRVERTFIDTV